MGGAEFVWQDRATVRLREFVTRHIAENNTPGISLALTARAGVVKTFTYGFRELASRTPVEADALFEIGSIGKAFTAVAVLQLSDEGRLDVNAAPSRYLPWFTVRSRYPAFGIHHLLTHSAGLTAGRDDLPSSLYQAAELRNR
jgi:CubicO group peptidase (beta-lactamase class C family)